MSPLESIYMDHNATTPLDPRVLESMKPYLSEYFGNPSSTTHGHGRVARQAIEESRDKIADLINVSSREIVFTSGATEADNMAILGTVSRLKEKGNHIITTGIEHKAVLDTCKYLQKNGFDVTILPVDKYAMVDPDDLRKAITNKTILISIMYVNSEVGTIEPVEEIGNIAREREIIFHCDAVQAAGKIEIDLKKLNIDLLAMSSHKIYGPKGIGALYIRKGIRINPIVYGGGHERGLRPGTLNTPAIVGFGEACALSKVEMKSEAERLTALRNRFKDQILDRIDTVHLNGHPEKRQPGNLNFSFEYVEGESLILSIKDVALSSGSACTSDSLESSYVLLAMGVPEAVAHCSVRFGLGKSNTEDHVDYVVDQLEKNVKRLRDMSPLVGTDFYSK
jgi:cysteine desulfurase